MKLTKQLIVAGVFAAFGAGAMAQEATPDTWMNAAATKSREQVQAELAQAKKDGSIKASSISYDFSGAVASVKSRDQVRAELMAARESGEFEMLNAEVYAFRLPPRSTAYAAKR